jgi:hypothetical protein
LHTTGTDCLAWTARRCSWRAGPWPGLSTPFGYASTPFSEQDVGVSSTLACLLAGFIMTEADAGTVFSHVILEFLHTSIQLLEEAISISHIAKAKWHITKLLHYVSFNHILYAFL